MGGGPGRTDAQAVVAQQPGDLARDDDLAGGRGLHAGHRLVQDGTQQGHQPAPPLTSEVGQEGIPGGDHGAGRQPRPRVGRTAGLELERAATSAVTRVGEVAVEVGRPDRGQGIAGEGDHVAAVARDDVDLVSEVLVQDPREPLDPLTAAAGESLRPGREAHHVDEQQGSGDRPTPRRRLITALQEALPDQNREVAVTTHNGSSNPPARSGSGLPPSEASMAAPLL